MEKFIEIAKEHPIPIAIGVVILLLIIRGSSGPTSTGTASQSSNLAYQSQQLAVQSNTQIAGITSATTLGLGAQTVENNRIAAGAAQARTSSAEALMAAAMGATMQRDLNGDNNTNKVILASFARSTNADNIAANLQSQQATINGGIKINSDNLAAQITTNASDNNFKLAQIGAQTQGSLAIISGVGTQAQIMADKNNAFTASTLPTLMQHAETMAKITGTNSIGLAQVNTQAANTTADANARATNAKTSQSWVSSIASVIGSFL